jgi:hypothetical protein
MGLILIFVVSTKKVFSLRDKKSSGRVISKTWLEPCLIQARVVKKLRYEPESSVRHPANGNQSTFLSRSPPADHGDSAEHYLGVQLGLM